MLSSTSFFMPRLPAWDLRLRHWPTVLFVLAAILVLSHPFTGIRHDGTLYAGDALARLLPGEFHDDLYFYFGSQGRFTLVPEGYARLIAWFGLGTGTMVGLLSAFILYLAATFYFVFWIAPANLRMLSVLAVVLGWTIYGGARIFGYSESFFTARSIAEPAVLLALGLLVRNRVVSALIVLVVAVAIHPLIAAGGLLVAWIFLMMRDRRWCLAALPALAALIVLGAMAVGPFADVFARYDDQWLALVHEANGQAFVLRWSWFDYAIISFNVVVLGFAYRLTSRAGLRRVIVAAITAGVGATLGSLVLVDLLSNPFFGKLQIWRAEWVMQWIAMACMPLVVSSLWKRDAHGRVAALLLVVGWMAPFSFAPGVVAVAAILVEAFRHRFTLSRTTTRIVFAAVLITGIGIAVQYEVRVFRFGDLLDLPLRLVLGQAFAMNLVLFVMAWGLLYALPRLGWAGPLVGGAILVGALYLWDQRPVWTRKLESYPPGTHIWPGLIEPTAKVYWYRDLIAPWVLLGHGNYYTQQQGSGAVFSRAMVVELERRRKITGLLDFQEQLCRMMNNLSEKPGACEPDAAAVRDICQLGELDYVVLQSTLEGALPLANFSTGVFESGYEKKFFLYRCAALTKG